MPLTTPIQFDSGNPSGYLYLALALAGLNIILLLAVAGLVFYRLRGPGFSTSFSLPAFKRWLTTSVVVCICLIFMWLVRSLLIPFGIAFFLASLLDPVVTRMQHKGIPRGRSVFYIFLSGFLALILTMIFVIPTAGNQIKQITDDPTKYEKVILDQADKLYSQNQNVAKMLGLKDKPSKSISSTVVTNAATGALNSVKSSLVALSGKVLWFVIIPMSLCYFLLDFQVLRAKTISFFPSNSRKNIDKMSAEVVDIFSQYIRGLAKVCFFYGLTAMSIAFVAGVPYAIFLGLAAGALYAVPYAGPAIAIAGSAILALTTGRGGVYAAIVAAMFLVMHFCFDYGITPRIIGKSVGLHPLLNIFALMVGATYFGIYGMLLAVPVAACVQMVLLYFFPHLGDNPGEAQELQKLSAASASPEPQPALK